MKLQRRIGFVPSLILIIAFILVMGFLNFQPSRATASGNTWINWAPGSITVYRVVIDLANPNIVFAATSIGVYKSADNGLTWTRKTSGLPSSGLQNTLGVAVDNCDDRYVFLVTGADVYYSSDYGENWSPMDRPEPGSVTTVGIAVNCLHTNMLVAVATIFPEDFIDQRLNYGSWIKKLDFTHTFDFDVETFTRVAIDPAHESLAVATHSSGGVFISTNSGDTWNSINSGLPIFNLLYRKVMDVDFYNNATYIVINAGSTNHAIYKLVNNQTTWQKVGADFSNTDVRTLAFDNAGNIYVGTGSQGGSPYGVYRCNNSGGSCTQMNSGFNVLQLPDLNDLAFANGIFYAATNQGIWRYEIDCSPNLTLNKPTINNLSVIINGVTTPKPSCPAISNIHWNWGDGNNTDSMFPASHTYLSAGHYDIQATSYDAEGHTTPQTVSVCLGCSNTYLPFVKR